VPTERAKTNFDKSKMFVIFREIECLRDFSSMIFIGKAPHFICYKISDRASIGNGLPFSVSVFIPDRSTNSIKHWHQRTANLSTFNECHLA